VALARDIASLRGSFACRAIEAIGRALEAIGRAET